MKVEALMFHRGGEFYDVHIFKNPDTDEQKIISTNTFAFVGGDWYLCDGNMADGDKSLLRRADWRSPYNKELLEELHTEWQLEQKPTGGDL